VRHPGRDIGVRSKCKEIVTDPLERSIEAEKLPTFFGGEALGAEGTRDLVCHKRRGEILKTAYVRKILIIKIDVLKELELFFKSQVMFSDELAPVELSPAMDKHDMTIGCLNVFLDIEVDAIAIKARVVREILFSSRSGEVIR
jgi:hypothetical protein